MKQRIPEKKKRSYDNGVLEQIKLRYKAPNDEQAKEIYDHALYGLQFIPPPKLDILKVYDSNLGSQGDNNQDYGFNNNQPSSFLNESLWRDVVYEKTNLTSQKKEDHYHNLKLPQILKNDDRGELKTETAGWFTDKHFVDHSIIYLFGDNEKDKYRNNDKNEFNSDKTKDKNRIANGGQAAIAGKYDRDNAYGITTVFNNEVKLSIGEYKQLLAAEFEPLRRYVREGGIIAVPCKLDGVTSIGTNLAVVSGSGFTTAHAQALNHEIDELLKCKEEVNDKITPEKAKENLLAAAKSQRNMAQNFEEYIQHLMAAKEEEKQDDDQKMGDIEQSSITTLKLIKIPIYTNEKVKEIGEKLNKELNKNAGDIYHKINLSHNCISFYKVRDSTDCIADIHISEISGQTTLALSLHNSKSLTLDDDARKSLLSSFTSLVSLYRYDKNCSYQRIGDASYKNINLDDYLILIGLAKIPEESKENNKGNNKLIQKQQKKPFKQIKQHNQRHNQRQEQKKENIDNNFVILKKSDADLKNGIIYKNNANDRKYRSEGSLIVREIDVKEDKGLGYKREFLLKIGKKEQGSKGQAALPQSQQPNTKDVEDGKGRNFLKWVREKREIKSKYKDLIEYKNGDKTNSKRSDEDQTYMKFNIMIANSHDLFAKMYKTRVVRSGANNKQSEQDEKDLKISGWKNLKEGCFLELKAYAMVIIHDVMQKKIEESKNDKDFFEDFHINLGVKDLRGDIINYVKKELNKTGHNKFKAFLKTAGFDVDDKTAGFDVNNKTMAAEAFAGFCILFSKSVQKANHDTDNYFTSYTDDGEYRDKNDQVIDEIRFIRLPFDFETVNKKSGINERAETVHEIFQKTKNDIDRINKVVSVQDNKSNGTVVLNGQM